MRILFHKIFTIFIAFIFYSNLALASDSTQDELPALPIHFSYYTAAFELLTDCKQITSQSIFPVCKFAQLTNKFDTYPEHKNGFYAWLRRRDQSWVMYVICNTKQINLAKEVTKAQTAVEEATDPDAKTLFFGMEYPSKRENLTIAQENFNEGSEQSKLYIGH